MSDETTVQVVEPIQVRINKAPEISGDSRTELYNAIRRGELDLIKDEAGRSYLLYAQLKARCAARQHVKKPKEKPHLAATRDAYHARRKKKRKAKHAIENRPTT